jgi:hypothetical protein
MNPRQSTTHQETYVHIHGPYSYAGKPVKAITAFMRRASAGEDWMATFAFCSKEDQFSRRTGRLVARRRFFTHPRERITIPDTKNRYEAVQSLLASRAPLA